MDNGVEALVGFVGTHGDALEFAEEVLDQMAPFVDLGIDGKGLGPVRVLGDDDLGAAPFKSAMMALLSKALSAISASK